MRFVRLIFWNCLLVVSPCFAIRDIFSLEYKHNIINPLTITASHALNFSGVMSNDNRCVGFVEDKAGNIHQIRIGQEVGPARAKVIKIISDKILLYDGGYFSEIK